MSNTVQPVGAHVVRDRDVPRRLGGRLADYGTWSSRAHLGVAFLPGMRTKGRGSILTPAGLIIGETKEHGTYRRPKLVEKGSGGSGRLLLLDRSLARWGQLEFYPWSKAD